MVYRLTIVLRRASWLTLLLALIYIPVDGLGAQRATSVTSNQVLGSSEALRIAEQQAQKMLAGNVVGAVRGGAGFYIDQLQTWLDLIPGATGLRVSDNTVLLRFASKFLFHQDSRRTRVGGRASLDEMARLLVEFRKTVVVIQAHTDGAVDDNRELQLAEGQARAVRNRLASRAVDKARVDTAGYAGRYPLATMAAPLGRASNQRVDILIKAKSR